MDQFRIIPILDLTSEDLARFVTGQVEVGHPMPRTVDQVVYETETAGTYRHVLEARPGRQKPAGPEVGRVRRALARSSGSLYYG